MTKDSRISGVIRILHQQPQLRTSQLAAIVGLSSDRLRHLFKIEVGISITQYSMEVRLLLACELLATSQQSLKEICDEIGIPDPSNFVRYFKKRFDMTPSNYRNGVDDRFDQQIAGLTKSKRLQVPSLIASTAPAITDYE